MNAQTQVPEKTDKTAHAKAINEASTTLQSQVFYQAVIQELKHEHSCGEAADSIEAFGDVELELMKRGTLSHASIDWALVEQETETLLRTRSKDLRLLHAAILALLRQKSALALATGAACCFLFHHKFSSEMFPIKARKRVSIIRTIVNDYHKAIDQVEPVATDIGYLTIARNMWNDLTLHLNRSDIGDTATILPGCEQIIRHLDEMIELQQSTLASTEPPTGPAEQVTGALETPITNKTEDPATPQIAAKQAEPKPKTSKPQAAVKTIPETTDLQPEDRTKFCKALFSLADTLMVLDPSDRTSYLVRRRAIWHGIDQAPPAKSDQIIDIPNPVSTFSDDYETAMSDESQSDELLMRLEQVLNMAPYWFDGHFMAANFAQRMGYEAAAVEIRASLQEFLKRIPDLKALKFKDGAPLISDRVANWLAPKPSQTVAISEIDSPEQPAQPIQTKPTDLSNEDLMGLEAKLPFAGSERDQTWLELQMLEDMRHRGLSHFAASQAMRLQDHLSKRTVLDWESGLAVRLHDLAQGGLNHMNRTDGGRSPHSANSR